MQGLSDEFLAEGSATGEMKSETLDVKFSSSLRFIDTEKNRLVRPQRTE